MKVEYIVQPSQQIGSVVYRALDTSPNFVVLVSAFVGLETIMRIKAPMLSLHNNGAVIRCVLGIDFNGTSQEVLQEMLGWGIDIRIVKYRTPGHTFHPKMYIFKWEQEAEIIIGSSNMTEGGFFKNYEVCTRIHYQLPDDSEQFEAACTGLQRFIDPTGPTAYVLSEDFLKELISRGEVQTEAEVRRVRHVSRNKKGKKAKSAYEGEPIFGVEEMGHAPPFPAELLKRLVRDVRGRPKSRRISSAAGAKKVVPDAIVPEEFYMTLPTLQGTNIPGEGRIPLEAIELARDFWGWRRKYKKKVSPRAGQGRVYWNWRPKWRVWSVEAPGRVTVQEVRMYMYENSSDFRFYVRPIVVEGGDLGDIVRIRRVAQPDFEYECVLARKGTPEYDAWLKYCTQPVRNSTRSFGYA